MLTAESVKDHARTLGFDLCGVAPVETFPELGRIREWIARGYAGDMGYLPRTASKREDVRRVLPSARSVIVTGIIYNVDRPYSAGIEDAGQAIVSRYAWGDDYHDVIGRRLDRLLAWMRAQHDTPFEALTYVDTGPVHERVYAQYADQSKTRVVAVPLGDRLQPDPRGRRSGSRPVRHVHAVPRGVSDGRARRTTRARCEAVPLVPDHRAATRDSRIAAHACRGARVRVRHLPGRLSLEPGGRAK
jgi:hypothetical protein